MNGTVRKPRTPRGTWRYRIDLDARSNGVLIHKPASAARAPRTERTEMQAWTIDEASRFNAGAAGCSGIDITLDIYSHVPQAVRRDAADLIADLLSARSAP